MQSSFDSSRYGFVFILYWQAFLAHCNSVLHNQKRAKLEEQSSSELAKPEEESVCERAGLDECRVVEGVSIKFY